MSFNISGFGSSAMGYFLTAAGENRGKSSGATGGWDSTYDYTPPGVSAKAETSSPVKETSKETSKPTAPAPTYEQILKNWEEGAPLKGSWY